MAFVGRLRYTNVGVNVSMHHLLAPSLSLRMRASRVCNAAKCSNSQFFALSLLAWVICSGNDNHNSPRSPNQNQHQIWIAEAEVGAGTQTEPQHWRDPVEGAEMTTPLDGREEQEAGTGQTNKHSQSSKAAEAALRRQQQQQRQRCGFWFWVIHPAQKNLRCVRLLLSTRVYVFARVLLLSFLLAEMEVLWIVAQHVQAEGRAQASNFVSEVKL